MWSKSLLWNKSLLRNGPLMWNKSLLWNGPFAVEQAQRSTTWVQTCTTFQYFSVLFSTIQHYVFSIQSYVLSIHTRASGPRRFWVAARQASGPSYMIGGGQSGYRKSIDFSIFQYFSLSVCSFPYVSVLFYIF